MPQRAPLPVGKPILVRLDRIPTKTREKAKFRGEGVSVVVDLPMLVDDKTKAEHFEQVIFWSMPDRIRSGNGEFKPTGSYKFIEAAIKPSFDVLEPEQRAQALQVAMAIYDGNYLSQLAPEQKAPLLKHYVVYMKDAKTDDHGRVWEDPKEIKQVSELEWEVDARRMPAEEAEKQREAIRQREAANAPPLGLPKPKGEQAPPKREDKPASGLGLPKGNQPPAKAEDKPQAPPETPTATPKEEPAAKELTAAEVGYRIQEFIARKQGYGTIAKALLAQREAPGMSALSEDDTRLLLVRMQIEEQLRTSEKAAGFILEDLKHYETSIEALALPEARRLLNAAIAAANAPF